MLEPLKRRARILKNKLTALYYAYRDERTPFAARLMIGITVLYALSPVDLIPDFIPVLGYLDDLLILPFFIAISIKLIPSHIMEESSRKAELFPVVLRKNWTFGIVFIGLWLVVLLLIAKAVSQ